MRKAFASALTFGVVLLGASGAQAATETKTVKATLHIDSAQPTRDHCEARTIARWPALPDEAGPVVVKAVWRGNVRTFASRPPYDDTHVTRRGTDWSAPAGMHQYVLSAGSGDRPVPRPDQPPVDCSQQVAEMRARWTSATVEVQLKADAKIVGKVTDTDGDPVKGVRVRAKGAGGDRTDADGEYEIDVPERTRTYVVTPSLRETTFAPRRRSVRVKAGRTARANFRARYERAIAGRIRLGCKGQAACSVLPVKDVAVRASRIGKGSGPRRYTATTDEDGRYKLRVGKGRYRVQTTNAVTGITPARRTLDVTRRKRAKADFTACTLKPGAARGGALLNAVGGGLWASAKTCADRVRVSWAPAGGVLAFTWARVPTCRKVKNGVTGGGEFALNRALWVAGPSFVRIDPNENHVLTNAGDRIAFQFRVRQASDPLAFAIPFSGQILANGTGTVEGSYTTKVGANLLCKFEMKDVPIRRG